MAYNSNKGPQHMGDVQYEDDPTDVQIDFENDFIALKTNGAQRFIVSGSAITASVDISGSGDLTIGGDLTADNGNFIVIGNTVRGNEFRTPTTRINSTHVSSSLNISGSKFYGSGAGLTDVLAATVTIANDANDRIVTADGSAGLNAESNLTFDGSKLTVAGNVSASLGVTGSSLHTLRTVIDSTHVSSSLNISGSKFYGDGVFVAGNMSASLGLSGSAVYADQGVVVRAGTNFATVIDGTHVSSSLNISGSKFYGDGVFVAGNVSASLGVSGSSLHIGRIGDTGTVIDSTHLSSSLNISGSKFYGDGSTLSGLPSEPAITALNNAGANRVITSDGSTEASAEANLTFDAGSYLRVAGNISASLGVSGSSLHVGRLGDKGTVIDSTHLSSSLNISGSKFYGDGSTLSGLPANPAITSLSNAGANRIITSDGLAAASAEANLTFDAGSYLRVAGNVSASLGVSGSSLHVGRGLGTTGTVIDSTHVSSSLNISGSKFYGDGSNLTGVQTDAPGGDNQILFNDDSAFSARPTLTFVGDSDLRVTGSLSVTGSALGTLTVIDGTHVSSSLNISGSRFYGDGSTLTGVGPASPPGTTGNILFNDSNDYAAVPNLSFMDNSDLRVTGSLSVTGSALGTMTLIDGTHVSSSLNISGSKIYADGVELGPSAVVSYTNASDNRVLTSVNSDTINGESNLTFDGTTLNLNGNAVVMNNVDGKNNMIVTGALHVGTGIGAGVKFNVSSSDNSVLGLYQSDTVPCIMGITGSGKVTLGGIPQSDLLHLDGKLNVSGSDNELLISLKSDTADNAFYVSGSGDAYVKNTLSASHMTLHSLYPTIQLTSSHNVDVDAQIGVNSAGNILIQNNTNNKHIVFKANDNGTVREGIRLNGAVPEVVVNESPESMINFRVESSTNQYMLYVSGGTNQVGIGVSDPAEEVTLDISGSAIRLRNSSTPTADDAPGVQGEIRWDANYIYICVGTDTWKRAALSDGW